MIQRLDEDEAAELLAKERAILYKHSPTCWISAMAQIAVQQFAIEHPDTPVYEVDVLRNRPLSRTLAETLAVPHESPQVIVLRHGEPVWTASHLDITTDELAAVTRQLRRAASEDAGDRAG